MDLPNSGPVEFMLATGIENSYPTIALPDGTAKRVDSMIKCGHDRLWREDFALLKEQGIEYLRYGPPYYQTHLAPGRYDWTFSDDTLHALREQGVVPIADLCHFGVPDWMGDFQNPDFPKHFAEYAGAFARRFPWIRLYTPVNEILIAAKFSAAFGWWNERLKSDAAFVRALNHLCRANLLAMEAILELRPDAVFVQSEAIEYFHAEDPNCFARCRHLNEERFLPMDLTYGRPLSPLMREYVLANGLTESDLDWFAEHKATGSCVIGCDYYETNEHLIGADGTMRASCSIFGLYVLGRQYHARYGLPLMHTETNMAEPRSVEWLRQQWANMVRLKQDGVPVVGFTWYSLTDQVDWCTQLRDDVGRVNSLGLYDLDRKIRPAGRLYRELLQQWRGVLTADAASLAMCG
jgi:beta-glucosidase/6-phospho-beta-glucosidase/beta-galactosidase